MSRRLNKLIKSGHPLRYKGFSIEIEKYEKDAKCDLCGGQTFARFGIRFHRSFFANYWTCRKQRCRDLAVFLFFMHVCPNYWNKRKQNTLKEMV